MACDSALLLADSLSRMPHDALFVYVLASWVEALTLFMFLNIISLAYFFRILLRMGIVQRAGKRKEVLRS